MNTETIILTLVSILLGPGVVTAIVQWVFRRLDARRDRDHERAVASSPAIRRLELEIYRQALFQHTDSRIQHEYQLQAGKTYLTLGGNGPGHVRYQQLTDDYRRRLDTDDWDYTPRH